MLNFNVWVTFQTHQRAQNKLGPHSVSLFWRTFSTSTLKRLKTYPGVRISNNLLQTQTTEQPLTRLERSIKIRVLATLIHFVHTTAFPQTRTSYQQQKRNDWNRDTCYTKHYSRSITTWLQLPPKTKCKIVHSGIYCCILFYFTKICI